MFLLRLQDHAGAGLTVFVLEMRAVVDVIDGDGVPREFVEHVLRQREVIQLRVVTAFNPGLIRNNDDEIALFLGSAAEVEDAIHEVKIFLAIDVGAIDIDDAVAIEEERFCGHWVIRAFSM